MLLACAGIVFVILGNFYIWKPFSFRRGVWMGTSITIANFSGQNYLRYMRALGMSQIFSGLFLVMHGIQ